MIEVNLVKHPYSYNWEITKNLKCCSKVIYLHRGENGQFSMFKHHSNKTYELKLSLDKETAHYFCHLKYVSDNLSKLPISVFSEHLKLMMKIYKFYLGRAICTQRI
jgi:hypothetical protein